MKALEEALAALAEARPDPAVVERLAAETVARRQIPFPSLPTRQDTVSVDLGRQGSVSLYTLTCRLCGASIASWPVNFLPPLQPDPLHLEWHNTQERRLRKIEEGNQ